ncbi:MAG TPA: hypothetical protein VMF64_15555 [Steroidobacteraceae bacterium]|nr:hypothetical protein [Steroidobacteraceae bacterium]
MKFTIAACLISIAVVASPAQAAGHLADVAVIDRDTGQRLETYYRDGEYWVAGEPGARYAIAIRNHLGERLLAVTSVDGVNVITGQSAGWDQSGYVLDPWEAYQIAGWRKSDFRVAEFAFTAAAHSYAARTGRPQNVGIIGVALFRELPTNAALMAPAPPIASGAPEAAQRTAPAADRAERQSEAQAAPAPAPSLGTGHGAVEYSYVAHTRFQRRQWHPDEIIRIRYDSLANLIAMGIVPADRYADGRPSAFPGSDDHAYVPDPPPFDGPLSR